MSIDRCHCCSAIVDTDTDTDCYEPYPSHPINGAPDICVCERCRERAANEPDEPPSNENVLP